MFGLCFSWPCQVGYKITEKLQIPYNNFGYAGIFLYLKWLFRRIQFSHKIVLFVLVYRKLL